MADLLKKVFSMCVNIHVLISLALIGILEIGGLIYINHYFNYMSQAEHGFDSQVFFITTSEKVLDDVKNEVEVQLERLPCVICITYRYMKW